MEKKNEAIFMALLSTSNSLFSLTSNSHLDWCFQKHCCITGAHIGWLNESYNSKQQVYLNATGNLNVPQNTQL